MRYLFLFLVLIAATAAPERVEATYKEQLLQDVAKVVRFTFLCLTPDKELAKIKEVLETLIVKLYDHLAFDPTISLEEYKKACITRDVFLDVDPYAQCLPDVERWARDFYRVLITFKETLSAIKEHLYVPQAHLLFARETTLTNLTEIRELFTAADEIINQEFKEDDA
ncbi:hypothetical protein K2W90_07035 [Candidatus Babeliales bacterium]|nr:hypothetical protein [Candidatus Babeliales bacterium]